MLHWTVGLLCSVKGLFRTFLHSHGLRRRQIQLFRRHPRRSWCYLCQKPRFRVAVALLIVVGAEDRRRSPWEGRCHHESADCRGHESPPSLQTHPAWFKCTILVRSCVTRCTRWRGFELYVWWPELLSALIGTQPQASSVAVSVAPPQVPRPDVLVINHDEPVIERPRTASARAWEQSTIATNNTLHALSRVIDGLGSPIRPGTAASGGVLRPSTASSRPSTASNNYGPTFLPVPTADDTLAVSVSCMR
jgi:hypothetical protein